ncbi:phosphatidylinositol-specific phospholipase C/glycerophosphodiester phosphodiesterase family protein [Parafilimonas sp.]|uniref:phosphatidylinositol-specific phospholipase C/glycerophosphodiester phosphodiesterase family protein n=1 Tax=Parafilimonas sp. TaxID=1969739 RepID=UPI0039E32CBB
MKIILKHFLMACACITALLADNITSAQQPAIHSHNDYTHALPFWDAYHNSAADIEADVYYVNGALMVAHNKTDIKPSNSLGSMYIQPIVQLFDTGKNMHSFYLMIDIKENQAAALPALMNLLQQHPSVFNRQLNKNAVQVFISGDRPPDSTFHNYPGYIMFDGVPAVNYAPQDLEKIVMISDDFHAYSNWNGAGFIPATDSIKIKKMIQAAHALGKPVRLWGAPDTQECWKTMINLHADVINTDKVEACRQFLNAQNNLH